jgi:hypothetical protein
MKLKISKNYYLNNANNCNYLFIYYDYYYYMREIELYYI